MITNSSIDRITGHKPSIYQYCSAENVMNGISHLSPFNNKETDIIASYMNNTKYMYMHEHTLKLTESTDSVKWTTSPKISRIELLTNLKDLINTLESQNSQDVYISYEELCTYEEIMDEEISGPHYALHFSYIPDQTVKKYDDSVIKNLTNRILQMRVDEKERNEKAAKIEVAKRKSAERKQQMIDLITELQDRKITAEEFAKKSKSLE